MPPTVPVENQPNEVIVLNDDGPTKADFEKLTRQLVSQGIRIVSQEKRLVVLENANANKNNAIRPTPSTWETVKSKISSLLTVFNAWRLGSWLWPFITAGSTALLAYCTGVLPYTWCMVGVIVVVIGGTYYYIYPPTSKQKLS